MPTITTQFATPFSGIKFSRLPNYPREVRRRDGSNTATEVFKCAWNDRRALADEILGWSEAIVTPWCFNDERGLYAREVQICPLGSNDVIAGTDAGLREGEAGPNATLQYNQYAFAMLTVNYATSSGGGSDQNNNEQTILEESLDPSSQAIMLPNQKLWWDAAMTKPLNQESSPGKIISQLDWTINLSGCVSVPAACWSMMDHVNSAEVTSRTLGLTFGVGCCRYGGGRPSRIVTTAGAKRWTVAHKFSIKQYSWNKFFNNTAPDTPVPIYKDDGSVASIYPTAAFATYLPGLFA